MAIVAGRRRFTSMVRRVNAGSGGGAAHPVVDGAAVADVVFVVLTIVLFAVLALCVKGAEKL
jgi:hypothetical protein